MTTISIVITIVIVAGIVYWLFRSERKEAHHLDELHINPETKQGEKKS